VEGRPTGSQANEPARAYGTGRKTELNWTLVTLTKLKLEPLLPSGKTNWFDGTEEAI